MKSFKSLSIVLLSYLLLFFASCDKDQEVLEQNTNLKQTIPKQIISKLKQAGFYTDDGLSKTEGGYIVEGDIFLTEQQIGDLATHNEKDVHDQKHYRTNNLVSGTRTIQVYVDPALGSFVRSATDQALQRYNALNLRITFRRTTNASRNDIRIMAANLGAGTYAIAGFPRNGRPHNLIRMSTSFYGGSNRLGNTVSVITHEIGHCIGFRHTDYANRGYSCGSGGNEGPAGVGAIHIPGTPTTFAVANSWMLACIGRQVNRPFIASDRTALRNLYRRSTPPTNNPIPLYRYYRGGAKANHFYTTTRGSYGGYVYEGVVGKIYKTQISGTVPLYSYYNSSIVDHFYTTNFNELGNGAHGWRREGNLGYVYRSGGNGRLPLYRFWNITVGDHFYTTNRNEGNNAPGYAYEGVACYIVR